MYVLKNDVSTYLMRPAFADPPPVRVRRVEALGFALMRRKTVGLKKEYRGMDGKALGAFK